MALVEDWYRDLFRFEWQLLQIPNIPEYREFGRALVTAITDSEVQPVYEKMLESLRKAMLLMEEEEAKLHLSETVQVWE